MLTRFFPSYAGITFDPETGTKIALLRKTCKGWVIESLLASDPQQNFSSDIAASVFRTASLSSGEVCVRFSETEIKKNKHIKTGFSLRSDSLLPFPKEDATSQLIISPFFKGKKHITSFITRKALPNKLISELAQQNLFPDRISGKQVDYLSLIPYNAHPPKETYIVLFADKKEITFFLIVHNILKASRCFSLDQHSPFQIKIFVESLSSFIPNPSSTVIQAIGLSEENTLLLEHTLNIPILPLSFKRLPPISHEQWIDFGPAIAAALSGAQHQFRSIDFATDKIVHPKFKERLQQILLPTFGLSAFLSLVSIGACQLSISSLKREAKMSFCSLRSLCEKPQSSVPLSRQGFKKSTANLVNSLRLVPPQFPKIPLIASPGQILSFLSKNLKNNEQTLDTTFSSFSYKMESYPSQKFPTKKYSVKILLEGSYKNSIGLVKLKTALTNSGSLVDLEKPIELKEENECFQLVFYLKDRTPS